MKAVLLVDDNAVQAATRQTILERAGYFVIAVLSPQRALDQFLLGNYPVEIGLVVTDHFMPGMNGSEFVGELRKRFPRIPVLVISGQEDAEHEYRQLNVQFRLKPLLPEYLLSTVRDMMSMAA